MFFFDAIKKVIIYLEEKKIHLTSTSLSQSLGLGDMMIYNINIKIKDTRLKLQTDWKSHIVLVKF